jgi:glycosyltransferase involved in cell wall biosynthesis
MRVLVIAHGHPDLSKGGGELAAYQQFRELRKRGIDAYFLAAHKERRLMHGDTPLSILRPNEILFFSEMQDYFYLQPPDLRPFTHHLRILLDDLEPDVIHFHHLIHIGVQALRAAHNYKRSQTKPVRIIFTLHEYIFICAHNGQMIMPGSNELCTEAGPLRCAHCLREDNRTPEDFYLRDAFFRSSLQVVDRFISPSYFLKRTFEGWGLKRPLDMIENGQTPVPKLAPRGLAPGESRTRFAYLGQINHFKGLDILLDALRHMPDAFRSTIHISIHGSGLEHQTKEFQARVHTLAGRYQDLVTLQGPYVPEELPGIFEASDTIVVPSIWWENSPLVIQEAFKYGRPLIVSNIGGMKEKVRHQLDGFHFVRGSSASLATAMQKMSDVQTWQSAYDNLPTPITIEDSVDRILACYG